MKRSFSNATIADAVVVVNDAKASIVDALPAEMFCEISYHLPDLASLLCLAGTCKITFVSVFRTFRACRIWDYALPADWDGESIVPVAFFGQFLDAVKDTCKADHDRMVKYVLRRDAEGKFPNACKLLPDFIENIVLCGGPKLGEEERLLAFMREHFTPELVTYLQTEYAEEWTQRRVFMDPLYLAVVNLNTRAVETLLRWAHDQSAPLVFYPEFWAVAKNREWRAVGPDVDAHWTKKKQVDFPVDFLTDVLAFSEEMECPWFFGGITTFWRVLLHVNVTLDDIRRLGPPTDLPIPANCQVEIRARKRFGDAQTKIDHFKKHVFPSLEVNYVLV
jgi:hypothetical protein